MKVSTLALILSTTPLLLNCSKQGGLTSDAQTLVAQAQVAHSVDQGSHRLKLSSIINTLIPNAEEAIQSPDGQANLGTVMIEPLANGQSQINLDLDLSTLVTNPPESVSLNIDGLDVSNVVSLPVGHSGSSVFFSVLHNLLGISMVVAQAIAPDSAFNILVPLALNTTQGAQPLSGFTGIFKGDQNVVSIFADIAPILDQVLQPSTPSSSRTTKIISGVTDIAGGVAAGYVTVHTGSPFLGKLANGLVHKVIGGLVSLVEHH